MDHINLIMNDITAITKQSTTKPCTYYIDYTVLEEMPGTTGKWKPVHLTLKLTASIIKMEIV